MITIISHFPPKRAISFTLILIDLRWFFKISFRPIPHPTKNLIFNFTFSPGGYVYFHCNCAPDVSKSTAKILKFAPKMIDLLAKRPISFENDLFPAENDQFWTENSGAGLNLAFRFLCGIKNGFSIFV